MKDVIVIGAGMAGLICAQQLKQAGLDVTVVEKSAGVGGRMATRRLQGTWVDHGAQLISVKSDSFGRFIRLLLVYFPQRMITATIAIAVQWV